ncbi:hypothetical protein C8T65DRAFT_84202 [Cerioporus squamosus]|nr:hypothetical protein C8T65DRAFT_84202 [Cerioporus squamosus]
MTTLLTPISEQNVGSLAGFDEDVEPDTQWKEALRVRIEKELQSMADKVRQERDAQLRGSLEGSPQYEAIIRNYQASMDRVRRIAQDQFNQELKIARFERSLALGKEVEGEEFEAFRRQQQAIWEAIKKGGAERPQGRRDSNVASSPNQENGDPVAVPPRAGGEAEGPGTPYRDARPRETEPREGPAASYRDARPLARTPLGSESRPRDRTQSGGSDQFAGTPGSYGTRPARSRGNSSVFGADFDPTATSSSPYDQGSIGRQSLSSLSRTRPQDIWLPSPTPPPNQPATSRAFAHAAASNASPVSPNVPANENGRTLSRAASVRSTERPSPVGDLEPGSAPHRDRFPLGTVEERTSTRKGKEPDRSEHQRQPSFTQQTAVHEIYARRPDSRMTMPITPSRPTLASQTSEDQYFPQISPVNPRYRQDPDDGEGIPIRSSRRSVTSDQGSPENVRYGPPSSVSARPIPSKRSYNGDLDAWPQPPSASRPYYGPQSPPTVPGPSSSRPIPRPANGDDDMRRHSPSGAWHGSQSPPSALPFAGYDIPTSSSPRHRFAGSPTGSVSGRRNSNGSRSVRSRSSRQEFWGPSDVAQRPLPTYEEQSVASGSDSEEDYGMDLDGLWHIRERQEMRDRHWQQVRDRQTEEARRLEEEARRKEEEAARKEAEARRKEEEARRQAEEARKKEEEVWQKALEVQQKAEELARREAELLVREAEARLQEEKRKREEAEARLQEEVRRRQEAEERRAREEAERRERDREERERRDREEKERREREERDRKDREERERREREERREWEEKARLERERREREERERRAREQREMEERLKRQREDEARLAQEKREWEEARKREEEARAAAQAQAILEASGYAGKKRKRRRRRRRHLQRRRPRGRKPVSGRRRDSERKPVSKRKLVSKRKHARRRKLVRGRPRRRNSGSKLVRGRSDDVRRKRLVTPGSSRYSVTWKRGNNGRRQSPSGDGRKRRRRGNAKKRHVGPGTWSAGEKKRLGDNAKRRRRNGSRRRKLSDDVKRNERRRRGHRRREQLGRRPLLRRLNDALRPQPGNARRRPGRAPGRETNLQTTRTS